MGVLYDLPPALPNYHYWVAWDTNLVHYQYSLCLCPWCCCCLPSWMPGAFLVWLCWVKSQIWKQTHIFVLKNMICTSIVENVGKSLTECSLNDQLCNILFRSWSEASRVSDGSLNTTLTTLRSSLWSLRLSAPKCSRPNAQMASAIWSMMLSPHHHMSPLNRKATLKKRSHWQTCECQHW